jgi:hypothetical protein
MAILIAAGLGVSLLIAQLGNTPWAQGIRASDAKYRAEHPRPPAPAIANRRQVRRPMRSFFKPFIQTALSMGIPAAVTLAVIAAARLRRG